MTVASAVLATIGFMQLGCVAGVSLSSVWTDPSYTGKAKTNVLIVGIARRPESRITFEYQLKHELTSKGVVAVASVDVLPKDVQLDKDSFAEFFGTEHFDAILITGVVNADTSKYYTPGTTTVGHYNTWHGYYGSVHSVHTSPGYWSTDTEYVLESNLWDMASDRLIWRGISNIYNPESAVEAITELSTLLVNQLGKDGMVTLKKDE